MKTHNLILKSMLALFFTGLREQFCTANMEQGTYANPNPLALQRTSGLILFRETGATSYDDLGVIEMVKVDYGVETEKVQFALTSGAVVQGINENIAISPVLTINGRQFTDANEAYLQMGRLTTDDVQASAPGATTTVTAKLGKTFNIGKRNLTFTSATVSAAPKIRDTDFYFEEAGGLGRFPAIAAGIADGASVVFTYDAPADTRKVVNAGTILNYYGDAIFQEFDNKATAKLRCTWTFPTVVLSPSSAGDGDPKKNKTWEMKLSVLGAWTKRFRNA